jgi:hypothetical protein
MSAEPSLDLSAPGKLKAMVENQSTATFYIVVPQAHYTKDALSRNPTIAAADQLMSPFTVPANAVGADGSIMLDLNATGRGKELIAKVDERIKAGKKPDMVRAIVIAKAKADNHVPPQQLAEVQDLKLITLPTIALAPPANTAGKTFVTVQQHKAGVKNFSVELKVTGPITEVALTTEPAMHIKATPGGEGQGRVHLAVKEGTTYQIAVPLPFKMKREEQGKVRALITAWPNVLHKNPVGQIWEIQKPHHAAGDSRAHQIIVSGPGGPHAGWPRCCWGYCYNPSTPTAPASGHCHFCHNAMAQAEKGALRKREVWEGGTVTLKAMGTGKYAHITASVVLKAESWASEWLKDLPPAPLMHGAC